MFNLIPKSSIQNPALVSY